MDLKTNLRSMIYIFAGAILVWSVVFANNIIYPVVLARQQHSYVYVNDILSDVVYLLVALVPALFAPKFFGYQLGTISRHWKMLLGMTIFFIGAPLFYRLLVGETPFSANTWFFEGIVVPLAEEGFFRGILLSMLLRGFGRLYKAATADWLAIIFSALIFSTAHLNNLGHYPTGFILFQVGFGMILGLCFGYTRVKTGSIYPAILLHAFFNLAGTL